MKTLFLLLLPFFYYHPDPAWMNRWAEAQALSTETHKPILINFSGSDWCVPCMRMHKEIFAAENFQKFAAENLVLYNADFPRMKKNQLPKEKAKDNEQLADRYNANGQFPLTILLDEHGRVMQSWDGFPNGSVDDFIHQLQEATGKH
jgi:thioredoxin-related protein